MNKRERKSSHVFLTRSLLLFLGVIALFSFVMLVYKMSLAQKEQADFEKLSKIVVSQRAPSKQEHHADDYQTESPDNSPKDLESQDNPYAELTQMNPDFAAWLRIPGTKVDYPVMFTPDDPEYYLRRAFDKTYSLSGTPFIGANASLDSSCCIIYGHNMKNGTMFGTLERYVDPEFWDRQRIFILDTVTEHRSYEVFAVVKTKILAADTPEFQFYRYAGDLDEMRFKELIDGLQAHALYATNVQPNYGEQILLLSTCSYHTQDGRLLVAAKEIA